MLGFLARRALLVASQRKTGAVLGYANIVVKNVVNLLYTPMLLAFVGQGDYGVFQTANNFIVSLQLLTFGFSGAYVRFYMQRATKGDEKGIRKLNGMYLLLYLGICAAAVVFGLLFAFSCGSLFSGSFTDGEINLAGAVMAVLTFNVATTLLSTVFDAYIVAHERFAFQQTRQMFTTLAIPGLALCLLASGMGVVGVAMAQLAVNLVLLALNTRYATGRLGMRFEFKGLDGAMFKSVAVFSGWLFLNQVFDLVTMNIPSVILAAVSGAAAVAVFAIAAALRAVFYSLSTTVSGLFVPLVNRMVAESDDNRELIGLMVRVGRYQALVLWWVLGGFAVVGQWFVSVWAGPEYSDAYWYTLAMVAAVSVPLVQNTGIEIQKAKNRHKARSIAYLATSIVDLAVTYVLASHVGAWAAVAGYVTYLVLGSWLFMNWYYHRRIGLDMVLFWKRLLPVIVGCALPAALCVAGTLVVPVADIFGFLAWGLVYTCLCALLQWKFVLNDDEKSQFGRLLAKFKGKRP